MRILEGLLLAIVLVFAIPVFAAEVPPSGQPTPAKPDQATPVAASELMATPRLLAESLTVTPGGTLTVAIEWTIKPGWHMYWDGQNDTGLPPSVELVLPQGVTAGRWQWPTPKRYVSPGDLLDYVHEGRLVLLANLTIPATSKAGDRLTIGGKLAWQVCEEMCILEEADREIVVTVTDQTTVSPSTRPAAPQESPDAEIIRRARAELPRPLTPDAGITIERADTTLTIRVPGATKLTFHPRAGDPAVGGAWLEDGLSRGEQAGDLLRLTFDLTPRGREFPAAARGVLEVTRGGEKDQLSTTAEPSARECWLIDEPLKKVW